MTVDYAADLQAVTDAVWARVRVEGYDAARLRVVRRDGRWVATVAGHAGQTIAAYTVTYRPGRRPVVMAGTAQPQHGARPAPGAARPADNRPTGRRDSTRPDPARMAQLDYDGLAAYALELLDRGLDAAGRAVYAEMERREEAEKAAASAAAAAEQDDAHRRARALSAVDRRRGETTRQALRREYDAWMEHHYAAAEAACNGQMLSPRGRLAGADPRALFEGPLQHAYPYASEELRRWWEQHGRMTFAAWQAQRVGGRRERAAAATPRTGRDYV